MAILSKISPFIFNDGINRCNALGLNLIKNLNCEEILDIGYGHGELTIDFA